jgi:hypothetical protein
MSPWEIIGWTIAIPMVVFAALFAFAVLVVVVRAIASGGKTSPTAKVTPLRKVGDE